MRTWMILLMMLIIRMMKIFMFQAVQRTLMKMSLSLEGRKGWHQHPHVTWPWLGQGWIHQLLERFLKVVLKLQQFLVN